MPEFPTMTTNEAESMLDRALTHAKVHVVQYYIAWGNDLTILETVVNERIAEGFMPIGGVAIARNRSSDDKNAKEYCQAMLRDRWMTQEEAENAKQRTGV